MGLFLLSTNQDPRIHYKVMKIVQNEKKGREFMSGSFGKQHLERNGGGED
jgi:hypothetical protein